MIRHYKQNKLGCARMLTCITFTLQMDTCMQTMASSECNAVGVSEDVVTVLEAADVGVLDDGEPEVTILKADVAGIFHIGDGEPATRLSSKSQELIQ